MTYPEATAYIASLEPRGWRLGLDRMREFVRRAGLEEATDGSRRSYLHVAGTNGKGSTTAYLQSLLVAAGASTGAFYSPYVYDPRERVQLGRELISQTELAACATLLRPVAEAMDETEFAGVTEFEFKTALGFLAWDRAGIDWVALETGLGGRLDATNVVVPAASVIVSIGLDHQAILGETLGAIAGEKAGIVKPGKPLVLGAVPPEAETAILAVARALGSEVWRYGRELRWDPARGAVRTPTREVEGLVPGLLGVWQPHDLTLAIGALELAGCVPSPEALRIGAAQASAPGRFQRAAYKGREVILDGAHNPDSAEALGRTLAAACGPATEFALVANMLQGHAPEAFFGALSAACRRAFVPPIDVPRTREPAETAALLRALGFEACARESPEAALEGAYDTGLPILVTGSFYLVGEVGRLLGL